MLPALPLKSQRPYALVLLLTGLKSTVVVDVLQGVAAQADARKSTMSSCPPSLKFDSRWSSKSFALVVSCHTVTFVTVASFLMKPKTSSFLDVRGQSNVLVSSFPTAPAFSPIRRRLRHPLRVGNL